MKYKAAVFDLDGTLINTIGDLANAVNYACESVNAPKRTVKEVNDLVGNGIKNLVYTSLPNETNEDTKEFALNQFKEYYKTHLNVETVPYKGINEMLTGLKNAGLKLGVLTNKKDSYAQELIKTHFGDIFCFVTGELDGMDRKPSSKITNYVLNAMGVSAAETVYIGDSSVDVETAKNANLDCIGVSWGFRGKEHLILSGCPVVVDTAQELYSEIIK